MAGEIKSRMLNCGRRTYFFDIKRAQTGKPYLQITESRFVEKDEKRRRGNIIIFPEDIENFKLIFNDVAKLLAK